MPAPKKYNKDYHDAWGWSLAIKGSTDAEIADAFGVTQRTINLWKFTVIMDAEGNEQKVLSSFGEALQMGKDAADAKVQKSLYKKAIGYEYKEEERIVEYDMEGNVKPVRVKTSTKHVQPDTMACMYWLNNRKRKTGEWTQKQPLPIGDTEDFQKQMQGIADLINNPASNRALPEQGGVDI